VVYDVGRENDIKGCVKGYVEGGSGPIQSVDRDGGRIGDGSVGIYVGAEHRKDVWW